MLLSYLYLRHADWWAVLRGENWHFILLPNYKMSSVPPSRPLRSRGFAALAKLVARWACARGRARVTLSGSPRPQLGAGPQTPSVCFGSSVSQKPGASAPGLPLERGAQSAGRTRDWASVAGWSPLSWEVGTEGRGTRAASWAPVLPTGAGSAAPRGWARKGLPRHLSANAAQPV